MIQAAPLAEQALTPGEPTADAEPALTLGDFISSTALTPFNNWLNPVARHSVTPVAVPPVDVLRPMIFACREGQVSGSWDRSRDWGAYFGTNATSAQAQIRRLWQYVRHERRLAPAQYEAFVSALAKHINDQFAVAAQRQRERLARKAELQGPAARAQAAAAVLEHLEPLQTALLAYDAATMGAAGSKWHQVSLGLDSLGAAVRQELS